MTKIGRRELMLRRGWCDIRRFSKMDIKVVILFRLKQ